MNEQGPVIDAVKQLLANIWAVLRALAEFLATVPERIEARVDRLENKALVFAACCFAAWVVTLVVMRPRK